MDFFVPKWEAPVCSRIPKDPKRAGTRARWPARVTGAWLTGWTVSLARQRRPGEKCPAQQPQTSSTSQHCLRVHAGPTCDTVGDTARPGPAPGKSAQAQDGVGSTSLTHSRTTHRHGCDANTRILWAVLWPQWNGRPGNLTTRQRKVGKPHCLRDKGWRKHKERDRHLKIFTS